MNKETLSEKRRITKEELWKVFFKENIRGRKFYGFVMSKDYKKMKRRYEYLWKKLTKDEAKE